MAQSVFISFGTNDRDFARKLNDVLRTKGVNTFFFEDDAIPGQKLHRVMRQGVNSYDRVILVCSNSSLQRNGVLNEIQECLQREAREGGVERLIPIRLDDFVLSGWTPSDPGIAQTVRDRVVADFRNTGSDEDAFEAAIARLMLALT